MSLGGALEVPPAEAVLRMGTNAGATVRRLTDPAPTLVMGSRVNGVDWRTGSAADDAEAAYRNRVQGNT